MRPARAAGRGEGGGAGDRGVDGYPARRGRTRALLRAARRTGRAPRPAAALDGNECRLRYGGDARRNPCPHRHRAVRRAGIGRRSTQAKAPQLSMYLITVNGFDTTAPTPVRPILPSFPLLV